MSHGQKDALIEQMHGLIIRLEARIEELEEKVNRPPKGPHNSSVPPSAGWKQSRGKKPKGQRHRREGGHGLGGRRLCAKPDEVRLFRARACSCCEQPVSEQEQTCVARYDKIEIPPIKAHVTRVEVYAAVCGHCGQTTQPQVPAELANDGLTGPNLRTLMAHLQQHQMMSYQRLKLFLKELLGLDLSEGGLVNAIAQVYRQCRETVQAIGQKVRGSPVIHSDETGARVDGDQHHEVVLVSAHAVLHDIGPGRDFEHIKRLMEDATPDVWVSDLHGAQLKQPALARQICLAHQLRDLTYAEEAGDNTFAPRMGMVLGFVFDALRRGWTESSAMARELRTLCEARVRELLQLPLTHPDAKRLQNRYRKHLDHLFTCLTHPGVQPTNNPAEQALRMSVIKRKVSSFRSHWAAQAYAASRSITATGHRLGLSPLASLRAASSHSFIPLLSGVGVE